MESDTFERISNEGVNINGIPLVSIDLYHTRLLDCHVYNKT